MIRFTSRRIHDSRQRLKKRKLLVVTIFVIIFIMTGIFLKTIHNQAYASFIDESIALRIDVKDNSATPDISLSKDVLDEIQVYLNVSIQKRPFPPSTPGLFLHVGKAGGSTIATTMVNGCHGFVGKPCPGKEAFFNGSRNATYFGALNTYVHTPEFHLVGTDSSYSNFRFYVANLRDPFTRFQSVFTYRYEKRTLAFRNCFPTLEDFIGKLDDDPPQQYPGESKYSLEDVNCTKDFARALAAGMVEGKGADHFYWNMKSILNRIPGWAIKKSNEITMTPPPFLALRIEHLAQDFVTVNKILGDPHPIEFKEAGGSNHKVQNTTYASKNITDIGRKRLCNALIFEYKAYFIALSRAVNLSDKDKQDSIKLSQKICPSLSQLFDDLKQKLGLHAPTS